jgi:hypothetical protein
MPNQRLSTYILYNLINIRIINHNSSLNISKVFTKVNFASFGNPKGSCQKMEKGSCDS